ncbi:hypothetical protein TNCV_140351 [Trichonephila clavipes]|uniref:Uncharacterized protein n=1 Tax=Trichonephila clavipes TaxID=2585209 RepID=A0A8X6UUG5_TRICX|nr:hypothetical protein TNCV_140351 [Trichonephila clavipes]
MWKCKNLKLSKKANFTFPTALNCKAYGHMVNYYKCPLFPKPRNRTFNKPNYSSIVESIVRPNLTFAQAAKQAQATIQPTTLQQMAPRASEIPARNQAQTQAVRRQIPPPNHSR